MGNNNKNNSEDKDFPDAGSIDKSVLDGDKLIADSFFGDDSPDYTEDDRERLIMGMEKELEDELNFTPVDKEDITFLEQSIRASMFHLRDDVNARINSAVSTMKDFGRKYSLGSVVFASVLGAGIALGAGGAALSGYLASRADLLESRILGDVGSLVSDMKGDVYAFESGVDELRGMILAGEGLGGVGIGSASEPAAEPVKEGASVQADVSIIKTESKPAVGPVKNSAVFPQKRDSAVDKNYTERLNACKFKESVWKGHWANYLHTMKRAAFDIYRDVYKRVVLDEAKRRRIFEMKNMYLLGSVELEVYLKKGKLLGVNVVSSALSEKYKITDLGVKFDRELELRLSGLLMNPDGFSASEGPEPGCSFRYVYRF